MTAIIDKRKTWLAERRKLITASDVAAILGVDPRRGPLAVYAAKVSDSEPDEPIYMRRGRRHEALIAEEYGEQEGREVEMWPEYELLRHPDIPWLAATPDARTSRSAKQSMVLSGGIPLEIKMAIGSPHRWSDGPPLWYEVQVQIQVACYGSRAGALGALTGPGPLATYDIERDESFFSAALPRLEEFRARVLRRDPPEADGLDGTTEAIERLWPTDNGATVALAHDSLALADALDAARADESAAKERATQMRNILRARIGEASFGALPDGSLLSASVVERAGYTVEPTEYRQLRRFRPKIRRR